MSELMVILKVPNFIYTSQMTVDFSLTKDEQGKHRTKISAAKQKKKKNQSAKERQILINIKCK